MLSITFPLKLVRLFFFCECDKRVNMFKTLHTYFHKPTYIRNYYRSYFQNLYNTLSLSLPISLSLFLALRFFVHISSNVFYHAFDLFALCVLVYSISYLPSYLIIQQHTKYAETSIHIMCIPFTIDALIWPLQQQKKHRFEQQLWRTTIPNEYQPIPSLLYDPTTPTLLQIQTIYTQKTPTRNANEMLHGTKCNIQPSTKTLPEPDDGPFFHHAPLCEAIATLPNGHQWNINNNNNINYLSIWFETAPERWRIHSTKKPTCAHSYDPGNSPTQHNLEPEHPFNRCRNNRTKPTHAGHHAEEAQEQDEASQHGAHHVDYAAGGGRPEYHPECRVPYADAAAERRGGRRGH